jgi:transcriptional regulator with XRE-family HTH domain
MMKQSIITTACRRSGLTIRDLANITGMKRSTLNDWIRHPSMMRLSGLIEIANAIGLTEAEWQQLRKGV